MNDRLQTDLIFIDFSKAVPHIRLLNKLKFYGIRGLLHHWISAWLTRREQRVAVDGESSNAIPVKSGVPQGTLLGPLMFLIYINDINENIRSLVQLFADDCVIYKPITTLYTRCRTPTRRPTNIIQMDYMANENKFRKCAVLRCTRSLSPIQHNYTLSDMK